MIIKRLSVKGYKRIMLNDIKELSVEFTSPYQLILGTNGSGKSSLLREISPLPGNPSDYNKGGYKTIEIEHLNHRYVLTSNYEGKPHHSCLKDGVEMNEGGTITVQKEIIRQEFGITEELHELLMGKQKFTQMGPTKRRELITQMSDNDLTYAFSVFKKLTSIVRDHQGTIKHIKGRLAKETDTLKSLETHDNIEVVVKQLQDELTVLMQERRTDVPKVQEVDRRLQETLERVERLSKGLLMTPVPQTIRDEFGCPDKLREGLTDTQSNLQTKQNLLTHYVDEHQKIEKLVGTLEATGVGNIDELNQKSDHITHQVEVIRKEIRDFTFEGDVSELEAGVQSFKAQLIDILSVLPSNEEKQFSRKSLTETEETITKMQSEIDASSSRKRRIDQDIRHILDAKETNCPKCGFVWKEGVSEKELESLQESSTKLQSRIEKATSIYDKAQAFRDKIKEYSLQQSRLRTLSYNYPKAKNLFDWLMEDERIYHNPSQYIPMVDHWIDDLHRHSRLWSLLQEKEVIDKAIKSTEAMSDGGAHHISDTLNELDDKTQTLTREIGEVRRTLDRLKDGVSKLDKREVWANELSELLKQLETDRELQEVSLKSEILGDLIRSHQSQLATMTHKLSEKKALEGIITDLEASLLEVEESHRANKLLAAALSPTDGVIAQQMTAFIDCLVQQVNDVISQVYSYPLKVYPCGIGSGELDYKFPIEAGNGMVDAKDVSMGSEGQQEIIDFAFKLVSILYLGFNDYPLYLDELGSNQDETHLTNVMNYVKLLVESHRHSQLFMISHYAVGHGGFTNAEVLVLDGTNITVPGRHNDHAEFS